MNESNYVITVGRMLGSGGAAMGQRLANRFGFTYINKELLVKVAEELEVPPENLEFVEERPTSIWNSLLSSGLCDMPYLSQECYVPTGRKLFETQSEILKKTAAASSCVIVGRCGAWLFQDHPRHISVFLHAPMSYRLKNVMAGSDMNEEQAVKAIERADKERSRYFSTFTGRKWLDLSLYDYAIDAGSVSDQELEQLIVDYVGTRFPELV